MNCQSILSIRRPLATALTVVFFCSIRFTAASQPLANDDANNPDEVAMDVTTLPDAQQVQVRWEVASETNCRFFSVERSRDLKTIQDIGYVEASSPIRQRPTYRFTDRSPLSGLSYYRLRQVDQQGTQRTSPWQSVTYLPDGFAMVQPNAIIDDVFTVQLFSPDPATATLIDILGRPVQAEVRQEGHQLRVGIKSSLLSSSYVVRVEQNGATAIKHVLRE